MEARFQIDEANRTKQQPLLATHRFNNKISSTPFDILPQDIIDYVISPMMPLEDKNHLMQVSQKTHHFFSKTFGEAYVVKLLHHVLYGEPTKVEAMIKNNPLLLLHKGTVTLEHTQQTFKGTALQIARYNKDEEMVAILQHYMEIDEIERQEKEQFPEGYAAYKIKEAESVKVGFKLLKKIFDIISESKVETDNQGNLIIDQQGQSALNCLRGYLKPKGVINMGEDKTDVLLKKAYELYTENYRRSCMPAIRLTYDSPKNMLAFQLILGIIQRYLPLNFIQDFCVEIGRAHV